MLVDSEVVDILETTSFAAFDFKAYFKDHTSPGIKPYLGVGFGNYTATTTVTQVSTTTNTEGTTTATVPVTMLNVGFDFVSEFGGMRFDVGMISGTRRDRESHDSFDAKYDYTGQAVSIGVFSFF